MKLSNQIPPIYEKCREVFGVKWSQNIVITYGDTVYCRVDISPDLIVHEETHIRQQADIGKDIWWDKYFIDPEFRLSQEIEAYTNQAKWIKKNLKDRNKKYLLLNQIAKDLSSSIYGHIISFEDAKKLLCG